MAKIFYLNSCKHKFVTTVLFVRENVTQHLYEVVMEENPQSIGNHIYCCFNCGEIFHEQPTNSRIVGGDGWSS